MLTCHESYIPVIGALYHTLVGYMTDRVNLRFWDMPIDWDKALGVPEYTLWDVVALDCSQEYSTGGCYLFF